MGEFYLLDHPPKSRQFYDNRSPRPMPGASDEVTHAVGIHTVEIILDRIAPDTGAENTAGFISRRPDAGSYAEIRDLDSTIRMVPDDYTTFSVAESGYNSRTWNLALACRVEDLDRNDPTTFLLIDSAGEGVAAYWLRQGVDIARAARWGGTAALREPCLFNHGDVQPATRTDAWAKHPHRATFDEWLVQSIRRHAGLDVPTPTPTRRTPMNLDTATMPATHPVLPNVGVQVRMGYGIPFISWQDEVGGNFRPFEVVPVPPPPFPVDLVNLRIAADGSCEIRCQSAEHPEHGTVKAWQTDPATGAWTGWAAD